MKKVVVVALIAALVGWCGGAQAAKVWDDMSWWGNTGAKPDPQPDSQGRSGYWWWPIEPASNNDDAELWGNRGIVYHTWLKPEAKEEVLPEQPIDKGERTILLNNVLFDFDKAVLKPEGEQEVNKLVDSMKANPGDTVTITGHTCDIGSDAYNMGLGQRRADAVKSYMVQMGIDPSRIQTVSKGESTPAVPNTSAANRKLNRRAEFNVIFVD